MPRELDLFADLMSRAVSNSATNSATEPASEALFQAISENDVATVRNILRHPENVDLNYDRSPTGDGDPLLVHALNAASGARIARLLVAAGASVSRGNNGSVRDKYEVKTPLWAAINTEIGAHLPHCDMDPADREAAKGLVALLLENGANPNASAGGQTPLGAVLWYAGCMATDNNAARSAVVSILLLLRDDYDADVSALSATQLSILHQVVDSHPVSASGPLRGTQSPTACNTDSRVSATE